MDLPKEEINHDFVFNYVIYKLKMLKFGLKML